MRISNFLPTLAAASFGVAISCSAALAVEAVATTAVNVRTGPGVSFTILGALYGGETVNIDQCQTGWCYVEHSGPNGWVSGRYLAATTAGGSGGGGASPAADAAIAAILGAIIGNALNHHSAPPPPAPALPYGPDTCKTGFVWRDAIPGDHVCVAPARRSMAAHENAIAGSRVNPTGAYGPNTCRVGFVWREAYHGDVVCVLPARRTQVHHENLQGPSHRVNP